MAERVIQLQVMINWQSYEEFIGSLENLEAQGAPFAIVSFDKCACCDNVYFFVLQMETTPLVLIRPVYSRQEALTLLEYFHTRKSGRISDVLHRSYGPYIASSPFPEIPPDQTVLTQLGDSHKNNQTVARGLSETLGLLTGSITSTALGPGIFNPQWIRTHH